VRRPPLHPSWVQRTRLIKLLSGERRARVTLLSAPAGYGKSSLLAAWVEADRGNRAFAWYSIDEQDNDLRQFVRHVVAAITAAGLLDEDKQPVGSRSLPLVQSSADLDPDRYALHLVDELDGAGRPVCLILDDFHLVDDPWIHAFVGALLGNRSNCLDLVISTRVDPPFALAKMRASGELLELRSKDLRFTPDETRAYLNVSMDLDLSPDDLDLLRGRLEGWPVGVQLAALSLRDQTDPQAALASFGGSHRFVLEFLSEEVLGSLPAEDVTFLTRISILDRFSADLCDAVTEDSGSAERIERMMRANLFLVALDDVSAWYRFHHLFLDLLRARHKRTEPGRMPERYRAAGEWFAERNMVEEAIHYLLLGGYEEEVCRLVDEVADKLWARGDHAQLARWLDSVPRESLSRYPRLCFVRAFADMEQGRYEAAEDCAQTASHDDAPEWIRGRATAIRAFVAGHRGQIQEFTQLAQSALDLLPQTDTAWRSGAAMALGDAHALAGRIELAHAARKEALAQFGESEDYYMWLVTNAKLALNARERGHLDEAAAICERSVEFAAQHGLASNSVAGGLRSTWAELLAETGSLEDAASLADSGLEICDAGGDVALLVWSLSCLIRVLVSRGALEEALEASNRIGAICHRHELPLAIQLLRPTAEARVLRRFADGHRIQSWLERNELDVDGPIPYLRQTTALSYAHMLAADGRVGEARRLLERLLQTPEIAGHVSRQLEAMIAVSLAAHAEGSHDLATTWMIRALELSAGRGFVRAFADEGVPCAEILRRIVADSPDPRHARDLLMAFPVVPGEDGDRLTPSAARGQFEELSARELDVLRLLATGKDNRDIGQDLFISLHTVKAHTRNIYAKLDVHNRFEATVRAKTLGILPE